MDKENKTKWEALFRGAIISATTGKFMNIVKLMDQKAQVMIALNSILIPVCVSTLVGPYALSAYITILTAIISILMAIVCIYPKRRYHKLTDREFNPLHFNDIAHMKKNDFKKLILPIFNDPTKLAETAIDDIYDVSRYSLLPKYNWLRASYITFGLGNTISLGLILLSL